MNVKPHLFQLSYWEMSGRFYCNDIKNLPGRSSKWYTVMRMLELSIEEYIELLKSYHAEGFRYSEETNCLIFSFAKEKDVKSFTNYINKQAKIKNYCCV